MTVASQRSSVMKELSCFLGRGIYHNGVTLDERRHISHNIPTEKLIKYELIKRRMRGTENWLNCQSQRVVIGDTQAGGQPVTSGVLQGSIQGPILFNIFINGWKECTLNKSASDTKLGGVLHRPDSCDTMQGDLDRLEK